MVKKLRGELGKGEGKAEPQRSCFLRKKNKVEQKGCQNLGGKTAVENLRSFVNTLGLTRG